NSAYNNYISPPREYANQLLRRGAFYLMKSIRITTIGALCTILFMAASIAMAQSEGESNPLNPTQKRSQVLIGPVFGINRNFHSGGFRTIHEPNCPIFEQGGGWGFDAGLSAEFQL